jgi:single-strand DNA-binding protein
VNNVTLFGNFVADPEMSYTQTGKAKTTFRLAVDSGYGEKKETEFINCVAWTKLAEKVADHGRKGKECAISGRMKTRSWEDKNTGQKKYATDINVNQVVIGVREEQAAKPPAPRAELPDTDDIPF